MKWLIPAFSILWLNPVFGGNSPYFLSTAAQAGDGIIILMKRYELDAHACNLEKFLELNNLRTSDPLFEGRDYKLPIMIYEYNGKSIRSTIGISMIMIMPNGLPITTSNCINDGCDHLTTSRVKFSGYPITN